MLPHSARNSLRLAIDEAVTARAEIRESKTTIGAAYSVAILLVVVGLLRPLNDGIDVWSLGWAACLLAGARAVVWFASWRRRRRWRRFLRSLKVIRGFGFRLEHDRPYRLRRLSDHTVWNVGHDAFFGAKR